MLDSMLILAAAGESAGLAEQFKIQWNLVIAQAINFGLVAAALYYLAYRPVLRTMRSRQTEIADGLQYAEEMKTKLAETEQKQSETLRAAQQEAQKIVNEARENAKAQMQRETEAAQEKVNAMLQRAREASEREREQMMNEVRQEVSRLVVLTTEKVLAQELSSEERARFNQAATREVASLN